MKEFTVPMALMDFLPVILFAVAAVLLQREFYYKMGKGAFALFAAGTIDVICAGFCKALYKLLYAAGICDLEPFNSIFFPLQSIGFLLAGLGVIAMVCRKQSENELKSVAPVAVTGTMFFVSIMIVGLGLMFTGLCILAARMKKPLVIVFFVLSFICMLGMGYLSSRDFSGSAVNWMAQCINTGAQLLLLLGVLQLRK
ncbi:MAG: hypothetical protein K6G60_00450 [Lachnospiraceae bacterium]|nr:hypothetical protein [Lachnospiraceae bacterium]